VLQSHQPLYPVCAGATTMDGMVRVIVLPGENRAVHVHVPFPSWVRSRLIGLGGSFAGYVRRTAASKERNAGGGGAIWQHLPVIYPCHCPALVFWPGPCSGVVGPARIEQVNREPCQSARPAVSRVVLDIRSYRPGRYKSRRQTSFLPTPRHATLRSEAFQRPFHRCDGRKGSTHAWEVVYRGLHILLSSPAAHGLYFTR